MYAGEIVDRQKSCFPCHLATDPANVLEGKYEHVMTSGKYEMAIVYRYVFLAIWANGQMLIMLVGYC